MPGAKIKTFFFGTLLSFMTNIGFAQNKDNWTPEQLIEPSVLAQIITANEDVPMLVSVGPGASIPRSVAIGPVNEKENLDKLATTLQGLKKNKAIVIYCGCCPFEHCPNVRPAIALLKEKGFTNYKLLNLPHNIKTDWLDKGYPNAKL